MNKEYQCAKCGKIIVTKLFYIGDIPEEGFCRCERKEDNVVYQKKEQPNAKV